MNINFKNTLKCKYRYLVLFLWVEAREFAEKNEKMLRTWLYWKKKKTAYTEKQNYSQEHGRKFH